MLAPKDNTIRNEPLLARHARWVIDKSRKKFRLAHMKDFDQVRAVSVLRPAHERRAQGLGSEGSENLLSDLASEDIRRQIHNTYLRRSTPVLVLGVVISIAASVFLFKPLWNRTDDLKHAYAMARGLPHVTGGAIARDIAGKALNHVQDGSNHGEQSVAQPKESRLKEWLRKKLNKNDSKNSTE